MASQQELQALEKQRRSIQRALGNQKSVLAPLENKVNKGTTLSPTETQLYDNTKNAITALETSLVNVRAEIVEMKTALGRYVPNNQTPNAADVVDQDPFATGADVTDTVPETVIRRDSITQQVGQDTINASSLDLNTVRQYSQAELSSLLNSTYQAINTIDALPTRQRNTPANQQARATLQANYDILEAETTRRANAGQAVGPVKTAPAPVQQIEIDDADDPVEPVTLPEEPAQANNAALQRLRQQSIVKQTRGDKPGDWRVKLRLGSGSQNFYKSSNPGLLEPLRATDGIVFPYTPSIQTMYSAEYNPYHPTHSNYQHYFYKGSRVTEVLVTGAFTAQDTQEANYMLAVIHFLKSASKMFYGQDKERGSPPPLLFFSGLGDYQFNEAPCVITQFNYILPDDVDYIRAKVGQIPPGSLQSDLRNQFTNGASWSSSTNRLLNSNLSNAVDSEPFKTSRPVTLGSDDASYVPTKMEITISLLPVQNRLQVSEGFSLRDYANGKLIKGGFW